MTTPSQPHERRSGDGSPTTTVCYRHPDRVTRLSCSNCARHICVDCSYDAAVGQRCPTCLKEQGTTKVVSGRNLTGAPSFQTSPVSFTILAVTVTIFALGFVSADLDQQLFEWFAYFAPFIDAGEWWRTLSVTLLHGGITHVLFNMYALYIFGPRLEQQVGSLPFAFLWLATAAGGSAGSFFVNGPDNPTPSVGASGAVFGLLGAWLFVSWLRRSTPAGQANFRSLMMMLALNAALPLLIPRIDWIAHVGGLVTGLAIAWLWKTFAAGKPNTEHRRSVLAAVVLVAVLAAIILL